MIAWTKKHGIGHFVDHLPEVIEKIRYQDTLFGHDRFLVRRMERALPHGSGAYVKVAPITRRAIVRW